MRYQPWDRPVGIRSKIVWMRGLPEAEWKALVLRAEGLTWEKVGEGMGLSKDHARRIHAHAVQRLIQVKAGPPNSPQRFYYAERFGGNGEVIPPVEFSYSFRPTPRAIILASSPPQTQQAR